MEEDGLSPEKIELVIVTHSHPDHMEGVEVFLDKPVRIAMGQEEERYLLESGKILFDMMGMPLPKIRIDFYLKEGELRLGSQTFHVYQSPGHSPGSLTIYWPDRKVLFTGDVVFLGGIGRTDFLEGNPKSLMEKYREALSFGYRALTSRPWGSRDGKGVGSSELRIHTPESLSLFIGSSTVF